MPGQMLGGQEGVHIAVLLDTLTNWFTYYGKGILLLTGAETFHLIISWISQLTSHTQPAS